MAVEANLNALLDKAWEDKALSDIVAAPVDALQGVSDGDAKLLKEAFNIKTVGDLGKNKYFRAAQLLTQLGGSSCRVRPRPDRPWPDRRRAGHQRRPPRPGRRDRGNSARGVLAALPHPLRSQPDGRYPEIVLAVGADVAALGCALKPADSRSADGPRGSPWTSSSS